LLGKVNPLALEEFAALEERHQFLSTQLEDLKATRRDLMTVVKEVDDRILEVFTNAYNDVAREFEIVFATLFPGGEGRLVLTEPDDMLMTGIDVEARRRQEGQAALAAVRRRTVTDRRRAARRDLPRPASPFYIMDEVEAALDDVNLGRLIGLIGELRSSSQIIVITHQKRTMEIADACTASPCAATASRRSSASGCARPPSPTASPRAPRRDQLGVRHRLGLPGAADPSGSRTLSG